MNLLRISDLSEKQILEIYDLADRLRDNQRGMELSGMTAVMFFPDSSIRTRITFEKGIADLGGHSIVFPRTHWIKEKSLRMSSSI